MEETLGSRRRSEGHYNSNRQSNQAGDCYRAQEEAAPQRGRAVRIGAREADHRAIQAERRNERSQTERGQRERIQAVSVRAEQAGQQDLPECLKHAAGNAAGQRGAGAGGHRGDSRQGQDRGF